MLGGPIANKFIAAALLVFVVLLPAASHANQLPTRVYAEGRNLLDINGYFQLQPDGTWQEVNQEGSDIFRVHKQTEDFIELRSISRGIWIKLDLRKKQVLYSSTNQEKYRFLYNIPKISYGSESSQIGGLGPLDGAAGEASTKTSLTWEVRADSYPMQIKFFSSRFGTIWPSKTGAYDIPENEPKIITHSCRAGDSICYGAWEKGNSSGGSWGIGARGNKKCERCCYKCGSNATLRFKQ